MLSAQYVAVLYWYFYLVLFCCSVVPLAFSCSAIPWYFDCSGSVPLFRQCSGHCIKSVEIRSFSGTCFFVFGQNTCIRTEYRDLLSKFPYSVRIQENTDQKKLRIWHFPRSGCSLSVPLFRGCSVFRSSLFQCSSFIVYP